MRALSPQTGRGRAKAGSDRQVGQDPHRVTVVFGLLIAAAICLPDVGQASTTVPGSLTAMKNRAFSSSGLRLGSALLGLFLGAAGADLYAADNAARVHILPRAGAEARKERAHGAAPATPATSRTRKYPHPANIPKPACTTCHADQAGDYAKRRPRPGAQERQRGRARLRAVPRQRARTAAAEIPGLPHRRARYLRHVPHRGRRAVPRQRARPGAGARRHPGAAVHRLPRRAQDPQAHQRRLAGECRHTSATPAEAATATCA